MNDNSGWIKLHRKILKWEWYDDVNTRLVFLHLLLLANHKDTRYRGQLIKRGQIYTGRHKLAKSVGISERSLRTSLSALQTTSEVTIKTTSTHSVITLLKYNDYQGGVEKTTSETTSETSNERPTNDQRSTTSKNIKNNKNEKEKGFENFSDQFLKYWNLYLKHREEKGSNFTPTAQEVCLDMLKEWGEKRAIEAIKYTIAMGWDGIRENESEKVEDKNGGIYSDFDQLLKLNKNNHD